MAILVGLGSPLLDITANVGAEFLEKYGLEENGAVLIDEENKGTFMQTFNEVLALDSVTLLPGGSALNTIRVFQWVLNGINGANKNERATFFGSVGSDREAEMLIEKTSETGVDVKFQQIQGVRTGTCLSLIRGPNRSLCACLAAADKFTLDFLQLPENAKLIESSKCFYSAAFFLTVCPEAVLHLATTAAKLEKPFLFNLSAEYIATKYKRELNEILPFVDVLFANDGEAIAYAHTNGFKSTSDLHEIALDLTLEKMVDTNGAGDAFCGGFVAAFACGFPMEKCIKYALSSAATIVQQKGCTFPEEWKCPDFD
uniref:Adenosine kinase n=1 Tax=Globodera pallida TaxID=36090 RepID=A0A183C7P9_GLOPA